MYHAAEAHRGVDAPRQFSFLAEERKDHSLWRSFELAREVDSLTHWTLLPRSPGLPASLSHFRLIAVQGLPYWFGPAFPEIPLPAICVRGAGAETKDGARILACPLHDIGGHKS